MKNLPQLVLNLLLNSIWQVAAVALAATIADHLLRSVTRWRHLIWVAALTLSLLLPLLSVVSFREAVVTSATPAPSINEPVEITRTSFGEAVVPIQTVTDGSSFQIGRGAAVALFAVYVIFMLYRSLRLLRAALRTRAIRRTAREFQLDPNLLGVILRCQAVFNVGRIKVLASDQIATPATLRFFRPLIVLPNRLIKEGDGDALTAAIGHEVVHVWRRDYLLNLFYELMFLPLSFHPAAVLIRRRIIQTRELRCDELVAERLLHAESYARSLLQLAGAAIPFPRRAQTVVVGIADADILEVRIMSLLKRTRSSLRRNIFLIVAASLLLAVPGVVAARWALQFNIDPGSENVTFQEPSQGQKKDERITKERYEREMKERQEARHEIEELRARLERETDPAVRSELETKIEIRKRDLESAAFTYDGREYKMKLEEKLSQELELKEKYRADLARQARISMDQAIQIATSQAPGKVLESTLVGEHWQGEDESAKPGLVLYHVVILGGDDSNPVVTHVWVNAVDGSVWRTEKERKREPSEFSYEEKKRIEGGVLNKKATFMPPAKYPEIAKAAGAEGPVTVRIVVDELGNVVEAKAVSGHPLLQSAAVAAARQARFTPTLLEGEPVRFSGALVYNFVKE